MKQYWFSATDKCLASTIKKKKKEITQSVQKNEQGTITDLRH